MPKQIPSPSNPVVTFGPMEVQETETGAAEAGVFVDRGDGPVICGLIEKTVGDYGATLREWRVTEYSVELWPDDDGGSVGKTFQVRNRRGAVINPPRAALNFAKVWARTELRRLLAS